MNKPLNSTARDVTIKYTLRDGSSHQVTHRVWDIDRFIAARQSDLENAKNSSKPSSSDIVAYAVVKQ